MFVQAHGCARVTALDAPSAAPRYRCSALGADPPMALAHAAAPRPPKKETVRAHCDLLASASRAKLPRRHQLRARAIPKHGRITLLQAARALCAFAFAPYGALFERFRVAQGAWRVRHLREVRSLKAPQTRASLIQRSRAKARLPSGPLTARALLPPRFCRFRHMNSFIASHEPLICTHQIPKPILHHPPLATLASTSSRYCTAQCAPAPPRRLQQASEKAVPPRHSLLIQQRFFEVWAHAHGRGE